MEDNVTSLFPRKKQSSEIITDILPRLKAVGFTVPAWYKRFSTSRLSSTGLGGLSERPLSSA
jgi:hypothetical protein